LDVEGFFAGGIWLFFLFFSVLSSGYGGQFSLGARSLSKRGNFGRLRARVSYSSSYTIMSGSEKRESGRMVAIL